MLTESCDRSTLELLLARIEDYPLLSHTQVCDLARRRDDGDQQALDLLVLHNLRLVVALAGRHRGSMPLLDAVQEGVIGLVKAARKFNPDLGHRFSTYATWWIHNAIDRGRRVDTNIVLPHEKVTVVRKLRRFLREDPTQPLDQLAQSVGCAPDVARQLLAADTAMVRMDNRDEDHDPSQRIGFDPWDDHVDALSFSVQAAEMLDDLEPRERMVIIRRFGLDGHDAETYQSIGRLMGITKERVRQIEQHALARLRVRHGDTVNHVRLGA